jgi:hypothetical protein
MRRIESIVATHGLRFLSANLLKLTIEGKVTHLKYLRNSFPQLIILEIRSNYVKSLQGFPAHLPELKKLVIKQTSLKSLQNFPKNLKIEQLIIEDNPYLEDLGDLLLNPQIKMVIIRNNKNLKRIQVKFPDIIQYMDLSYNNLTLFEEMIFPSNMIYFNYLGNHLSSFKCIKSEFLLKSLVYFFEYNFPRENLTESTKSVIENFRVFLIDHIEEYSVERHEQGFENNTAFQMQHLLTSELDNIISQNWDIEEDSYDYEDEIDEFDLEIKALVDPLSDEGFSNVPRNNDDLEDMDEIEINSLINDIWNPLSQDIPNSLNSIDLDDFAEFNNRDDELSPIERNFNTHFDPELIDYEKLIKTKEWKFVFSYLNVKSFYTEYQKLRTNPETMSQDELEIALAFIENEWLPKDLNLIDNLPETLGIIKELKIKIKNNIGKKKISLASGFEIVL